MSPIGTPGSRIIVGEAVAELKKLPAASVGLVFADPPYGDTNAAWDKIIPYDLLWPELKRVVRPDGVVAICCRGMFTALTMLSNPGQFKVKWVWEKSKATNFLNSGHQPLRKYEEVCVFYDGEHIFNPQLRPGKPYDKGVRKDARTGVYGDFKPVRVRNETGQRKPVDLLYFKTAESEKGANRKVWHSTQKPLDLAQYFIRTYSNPGDVVLDFACGSGTTLVAANELGRRSIGIELDPETAKTAIIRCASSLESVAHA